MVDIIYEQFLRLSMLSLILLHWVSMFLRVSAFSPTDLLSSLMLIKQTVESWCSSSLTWCFNRTDLAHRLENVHNMSKKILVMSGVKRDEEDENMVIAFYEQSHSSIFCVIRNIYLIYRTDLGWLMPCTLESDEPGEKFSASICPFRACCGPWETLFKLQVKTPQ